VPAIGSTSRWPQHSGPSSGGRLQRHDLNFIIAAEETEGVGEVGESDIVQNLFYANADRLFQTRKRAAFFRRDECDCIARLIRTAGAADTVHVGVR
jgi:hypothetical protein